VLKEDSENTFVEQRLEKNPTDENEVFEEYRVAYSS